MILFFKLLCATAFCFHLGKAHAEIHGTITGTTNYVYRMYSKSNNKPAIQANLDYQHPWGFYVGTTASSFDLGLSESETLFGISFDYPDPARVEIVPYVGWSYKLADDWRVDLQYSRYLYDGLIFGKEADYNEYYFFLHYKDVLSAQVSYLQDFYGIQGDSFNYELTGRYPLTDFLQFSATYGYAQTQEILLDDYQYWSIGLTGSYKFISLDLRYHDAMEVGLAELIDAPADHPNTLRGTIVFSLSLGF